MVIPERLLQGMHPPVFCQSFDSEQIPTIGLYGKQQARMHALAIEIYRARAAYSMFTTEMSRRQSQIFTNKVSEQLANLNLSFNLLAVDATADGLAIGELSTLHIFTSSPFLFPPCLF
jgi:hypothetical protein